MPDFLLEIGCEEIPARMIDAASLELRERVQKLLQRERLAPAGKISFVDTPRRLAVLAAGIPGAQPDITEQITGPSVSVAFKDGQPAPAAHAFARKAGIDVGKLERITTSKGEYLAAKIIKKGRSASGLLAELLPKEIDSIHWPKNMYWRKRSERFVRPVRWLVALLDSEVIPLEFDGVSAGNQSRGHRLLADRAVQISRAGGDYVAALEQAKVLSRAAREKKIRKDLDAGTRTISGARWREDKFLLDTVVNLTEWPAVIMGNFDPEFLELPEEVLVTVMRDHQKYFAVEDAAGKLLPHFLAVLNTDGDPQGIIRHGHERVLRARFNDARFFWQTDQKHPLRERALWLKQVTFQKDLGSYYEKTRRVQRLCSWLSQIIKQNGMAIRPGVIHKAALLSKTDLTTELVKEFTELQGIVGGLYARIQDLDREMPDATRRAIADAVYDHYKPESMDDQVPRTTEAALLSIGDKADSIAGMFALGLQPTGSKDPFALRRQANGIVRTIAHYKLPLSLSQLFVDAREAYRGTTAEKTKFVCFQERTYPWKSDKEVPYAKTVGDKTVQPTPVRYADNPKTFESEFRKSIASFFRERLEFYLRDALRFKYDVVNAVLGAGSDDVVDAEARAEAVTKVLHVPEFQSVVAAARRMRNILKQAKEKGFHVAEKFEYLHEAAEEEKTLAAYVEVTAPKIEAHRQKKEYGDALHLLSTAQEPVDRFFDKIMVMVDDERIRANRLALLQTLLKEFSTIADFSEMVTEGKESPT